MDNNVEQEELVSCELIDEGFNYRRRYKPEKMASLRADLRARGLLYPIFLRRLDNGRFQLIVGGRRFRAWKEEFGTDSVIKAKVKVLTDAEATAMMMAENNEREDPSVIEDAEGAARMLGLTKGDRAEAAARLGWEMKKLDRRLAVMNAVQTVRDAYLDSKLDVGHVEIFAALRKEVQERVMEVILKQGDKVPTVAQLKAMAESSLQKLENAIFDRVDCAACQYNTGNQQALFDVSFEGTRCTNKECFTAKTDAELEARRAALTDTYQVVRIVRPGDNSTVIALRADGKRPVGEEQAAACRTCADFGACVSAVPDSLGKTYNDVCFNQACNDEKVEAYRKVLKAAEEEAAAAQPPASDDAGSADQKAASSKAAQATPAKPAAKATAKAKANAVRNAINEYREKVWRLVFHRAMLKLPVVQSRTLLIAMIAHHPSYLNGTAAMHAVNKALGTTVPVSGTSTSKLMRALLAFDQSQLGTAFQHMAANVTDSMPIRDIVGYLNALEVKLEQHWKVNDDFFDILTKTELDAVCVEIGLADAAGKHYSGLKNGAKKEFVQGMLKVQGFTYVGAVPDLMRWDAKA